MTWRNRITVNAHSVAKTPLPKNMEYPTVHGDGCPCWHKHARGGGVVVFVDDNHISQFVADLGARDFPEQTMKEIQSVMECVTTTPTEAFHLYFGSNPGNFPNYGSIHLYHEKDANHIVVHSTNGEFSLCAKMAYNIEVVQLLLSSLYDMVKDANNREKTHQIVRIHAEHGLME